VLDLGSRNSISAKQKDAPGALLRVMAVVRAIGRKENVVCEMNS